LITHSVISNVTAAAVAAMPAFPGGACLTSVEILNSTRWYMYVQMTCGSGAPGGYTIDRIATCAAGAVLQGGVCVSTSAPTVPYTQAELASGLIGTGGNWDPARSKGMMDAIRADNARQPGVLTDDDLLPKSSPVTVSGSPVTVPQVTTGVKIIPNADGSTSTETTKQTTTFTPSKTGSTVADADIIAKESTVTTITTVNNTTNNTTTTTNTTTPPGAADTPESDLCKLHPDALACQKLGDIPTQEVIPNEDKQVNLTPDTGWGASDAACPAPRVMTLQGRSIPFEFDLYCQFARGVRPLFIGFVFLSAALMLVGMARMD